MNRTPIAISTPSLYAHLTWKQSDILVFLNPGRDGPDDPYPRFRETREVSDFLREIHGMDCHEGSVKYWGTGYSGTYSTLVGLERRGLVARDYRGRWYLSPNGRLAADDL